MEHLLNEEIGCRFDSDSGQLMKKAPEVRGLFKCSGEHLPNEEFPRIVHLHVTRSSSFSLSSESSFIQLLIHRSNKCSRKGTEK